jgi:hypothetical protein
MRYAALALGCLGAAVTLSSPAFLAVSHQWSGPNTSTIPVDTACVVVGLLLALRRPGNAMGWLLLGTGLFFALNIDASAYVVLDYHLHHGTLFAGWVAVLLQPSWAPAIVLFGVTVLVFPDGRFGSRPSKVAGIVLLAAGTVWIAGAFGASVQAIAEHAVRVDSAGTLVVLDHPRGVWAWWSGMQVAFFAVLALSAVVWLVQVVARYRRSSGEVRLQLKWLIGGVVVAVAGGFFALTGSSTSAAVQALASAGGILLAALPIALAIAVTKYRLYDIDRVVSRTVSYGLVTALVVGAYVGVVTLATKSIGVSSPVAVAVSTLVAAALFHPLRTRIQRGVDRRFNRARYDADHAVARFAARLRDAIDPEEVRGQLETTVRSSLEPTIVSVWMVARPGG